VSGDERLDRATAALYGLAIGDALGMPAQTFSPDEIRTRFGSIEWFVAAPPDQPIAAGLPAGSITDDTMQALLLADALIAGGGHLDQREFARQLGAWEDEMRARGSLDLLGPSTRRAMAAVLDGVPLEESGRFGTTNGAAMRVAPVGLVARVDGGDDALATFVDLAAETCLATHNTSVAIAGAAAVAAAVSAGIDGGDVLDACAVAIGAARVGAGRGHWVAGASISARIGWAVSLARPDHVDASLDDIGALIGTSLATQESVPAAFALLALFPGDPWRACLAAASLGGDADTIGAMAGAIGGACHGMSAWPAAAAELVRTVNHLNLEPTARQLLALRGPA